MAELALAGCTPEPLMGYLKALGVFRLVAEQADPAAALSWRGGVAHLTSKFDREGLTAFFRDEYRPTPIVVPWSGGDFFGINPEGNPGPFKKAPTATSVIEAVLATTSPRLQAYRDTIRLVISVMARCGIRAKADVEGAGNKARKADFIARLRAVAPETVVDWIDAAAQAGEDAALFNPLLGSGGGSDGNTHFSDNFLQNLWDCLPDFGTQRRSPRSNPDVRNALFGEPAGDLTWERSGALFDSGAVEGANATQGFRRKALINPWDFVLGLEGTLLFAGGMAKRLRAFGAEAPAFPFAVKMAAAGFGSSAGKEAGQKEVWVPLWTSPVTLAELMQFMREGRAQLGRRPARTGTDFSRAVATLGVSVGVDSFVRYGIIRGRVGGENYHTAAALGRFRVHHDPSVTLLADIDPWLDRVRAACESDDAPARYAAAFRRLDDAIIDACRRPSGPAGLSAVVRELGRLERCLSVGRFRTEARIAPLQRMSPRWLEQADDGSPEFRLAAALAGVGASRAGEVGPIRMHLEEVAVAKSVTWSPGGTSAVWSARPVAANLAAVFRRRQMEAFREGLGGVPQESGRLARLDDVLAFLRGETDDDRLGDLLWGTIGLDWPEVERERPEPAAVPVDVPPEFGLARLLVNPLSLAPSAGRWRIAAGESEHATRHDPAVFHAIAAGRGDAVEKAARRLRAGGLSAVGHRNRQTDLRSLAVVSPHLRPGRSDRLLAAVLFPLSAADLARIADAVLYPPEPQE